MAQHFTNLRKNGNKLTFDILDLDVHIVNSLRRIILSEIPTIALAFDPLTDKNPDIKINTNISALHNEFLAHRLSLIPFHFNKEEIDTYDPAQFFFKLKVKNTTPDILAVTTKDIGILDASGNPYPESLRKRVFPPCPITKDHLLITKLRPNIYNNEKGEELDIEMRPTRDIAKQHARWSPVSCATLWNIIDEEEAAATLKTKLAQCSGKEVDVIKRKFETLDKYRCFKKNAYGEACAFHFKVESECGLSPEEIFLQAFDILVDKMKVFAEGNYDVHQINEHMWEITVEGEDYTLINALQGMLYENKIRKDGSLLTFIGYTQPHPLDKRMVIKLKFEAKLTQEEVVSFLSEATEECIQQIIDIKGQWP
jgi:DNA-directed RNA polymerase subunit L